MKVIQRPSNTMRALFKAAVPHLSRLLGHWVGKGMAIDDVQFIVAPTAVLRPAWETVPAPKGTIAEWGAMAAIIVPRQTLTALATSTAARHVAMLAGVTPERFGNDARVLVCDGRRWFGGYAERDFGAVIGVPGGTTDDHPSCQRLTAMFNDHVDDFRAAALEDLRRLGTPATDLFYTAMVVASQDGGRPLSETERREIVQTTGMAALDISTTTRQRLSARLPSSWSTVKACLVAPNPPAAVGVLMVGFGMALLFSVPLVDDRQARGAA